MRHSMSTLATRARNANQSVRLYLGMLAEMLADPDEYDRDEVRSTVEDAGRDWYSDRSIAERGTEILEDATVTAPTAFWAKAFHNALRAAGEAHGVSAGKALDILVGEYGEDLKVKDIRQWIPENESVKAERDRLGEAIALVMKAGIADPRVEAMVLDLMA